MVITMGEQENFCVVCNMIFVEKKYLFFSL